VQCNYFQQIFNYFSMTKPITSEESQCECTIVETGRLVEQNIWNKQFSMRWKYNGYIYIQNEKQNEWIRFQC